jgi:hypothetical protein
VDTHDHITEEALKAQDGKKVPLTRELGGPVIGEATLRYDPEVGVMADLRIDDPGIAELLSGDTSVVIFRKES